MFLGSVKLAYANETSGVCCIPFFNSIFNEDKSSILLYVMVQRYYLLDFIRWSCLLKTFFRTLILMTQVPL